MVITKIDARQAPSAAHGCAEWYGSPLTGAASLESTTQQDNHCDQWRAQLSPGAAASAACRCLLPSLPPPPVPAWHTLGPSGRAPSSVPGMRDAARQAQVGAGDSRAGGTAGSRAVSWPGTRSSWWQAKGAAGSVLVLFRCRRGGGGSLGSALGTALSGPLHDSDRVCSCSASHVGAWAAGVVCACCMSHERMMPAQRHSACQKEGSRLAWP